MKIEIITYQTSITSITSPHKSSSPRLKSISPNHYILETSNPPRGSCIHLNLACDSYTRHASLDIPLKIGRKCRKRGWERLKTSSGRDEGEGCFAAYRVVKEGRDVVIIYRRPDTANFLKALPDDTPLGELSLPGTHESCAFYGYPISQCQQPSTTIEQQLEDGIRFLDIRLKLVDDQLLMYHGIRPQRSNFTSLLEVIHSFLISHPTETLMMSIKEESPPFHPRFSTSVYTSLQPYLTEWFLEQRIPTLGEVRGKAILMSRFEHDLESSAECHSAEKVGEKDDGTDGEENDGPWSEGMGIHPSTWPDSRFEGFEWDCAGTKVRTQDWYRVQTFFSIPEKFYAAASILKPTMRRLPISPPVSPSMRAINPVSFSSESTLIENPFASTPVPPGSSSSSLSPHSPPIPSLTLTDPPSLLPSQTTQTSPTQSKPQTPLTLSFTSAASFPLSPPTIIAKGFGWPQYNLGVYGMNSRFFGFLLDCLAGEVVVSGDGGGGHGFRIRGIVLMDFYRQIGAGGGGEEGEMAEILVLMNLLR